MHQMNLCEFRPCGWRLNCSFSALSFCVSSMATIFSAVNLPVGVGPCSIGIKLLIIGRV